MSAFAMPAVEAPTTQRNERSKGTTNKGTTGSEGAKLTEASRLTEGSRSPRSAQASRIELGAPVARLLEAQWDADVDGILRCPIPGHQGTARLIHQEGDLRLGCCRGRWRSLGEVRAAVAYGRDVFLSSVELATWTRRLAYEAGTFEPLDVLVPLPAGLTTRALHTRTGFALLIGLRWRDGEHRPVAFSVRFVGAWCAMTHRQAHEAVQELRARGVIHEAGRIGRLPLYLPMAGGVR
jgi:hypothetical protein